jgi:aryl-alcohol dehydrogenase-like predicted oxidoreductase
VVDERSTGYALAGDYRISRLVNGGWQLAGNHGSRPVDAASVMDDLSRLVDAGLTTFDCADIYGGVESLLGELIRRSASRIQVHTKLVPDLEALPRITREYVERSVDRCLRRLGVERLDLVQLHWWDYETSRYVETAQWLGEIQQAGKVRFLGVTNFDVPRLRELVQAGVRPVTHQVQYSLLDRRPENGMVSFCRDHGIQLLGYGTLAGGFLSERYLGRSEPRPPLANRSLTKDRLIIDEFGGWDRFQELLGAVKRVADKHQVGLTNVATRYILDRPQVAAVIVGARGSAHLEENLRTVSLRLDRKDQAALEELSGRGAGPTGDIYSVERIKGGPHATIMKYNLNRPGEG